MEFPTAPCLLTGRCYLWHLSAIEYILGDSAYQAESFMLPNFKKPCGRVMPPEHEFYNTMCARPRVKTEHRIGLLKNRFPYLKELKTIIECKADLQVIIKHGNMCSYPT